MNLFDILMRSGVALAAIYIFYAVASTKWPSSYYLLDDVLGSRVSKSTWSYILFRFAPLLVAATCAMGHLQGLVWRVFVATLIGFGHLVISIIRINPYTNPGPRRELSWYLLQVVVLLASACILALSVWLAPMLGEALPQWPDITTAIITGLIVVCVSVFIQNATSKSVAVSPSSVSLAQRKYQAMVESLALKNGIDRSFALAIVIVEDLQRPKWFRIIERRFARVGLAKTIEVGQSTGKWFIADEEGVDILLGSIGWLTTDDGVLSRAKMAAAAEVCNEGDGYVEFVMHVYDMLQASRASTGRVDVDGNPILSAAPLSLMRGAWVTSGEAGPSVESVFVRNNDTEEVIFPRLNETSSFGRSGWEVRLPIEWRSVTVGSDRGSQRYVDGISLYPPF